ncbi:NIPSNAP family protein [Sinisalibacter lacisalsi]|uniref:NIPSNAP family protein n=1 Tax=Sinisalibacter lacisalsi TaxID=1526570 RepID=A0ABQ1QG52_9RHOB|nr:NIPSNAP family protein [Sinisalibacter lacisalsi]GGD25164.1 NIPSNAP family protein [Sinisalibacter lacisalsi]
MFYELTTLRTAIFGAGKAAAGLEAWIAQGAGTLHGAWFSDIGQLNEVYLLRGYEEAGEMLVERERLARAEDPFGCAEHLVGYEVESYRPLDFMGAIIPGEFGPVYEIRTYAMKLNGLLPTMEKWQAALPKRNEYSPCTIAMYGVDGAPRLTQIWPYPSLEARSAARGQSVADGNWPPKGGPDWLTPDMRSTVAMPMAFSPLK